MNICHIHVTFLLKKYLFYTWGVNFEKNKLNICIYEICRYAVLKDALHSHLQEAQTEIIGINSSIYEVAIKKILGYKIYYQWRYKPSKNMFFALFEKGVHHSIRETLSQPQEEQ